MKDYKTPEIEVKMLDCHDIIATSTGTVTTEEIKITWKSAYETE